MLCRVCSAHVQPRRLVLCPAGTLSRRLPSEAIHCVALSRNDSNESWTETMNSLYDRASVVDTRDKALIPYRYPDGRAKTASRFYPTTDEESYGSPASCPPGGGGKDN